MGSAVSGEEFSVEGQKCRSQMTGGHVRRDAEYSTCVRVVLCRSAVSARVRQPPMTSHSSQTCSCVPCAFPSLPLADFGMRPKNGLSFVNSFSFSTPHRGTRWFRRGLFMTLPSGQNIELHTLCIAPEHQRQGLGTAVTGQVLDNARERGCDVVLSVLKANGAARALYERLGFVVTGESTFTITCSVAS